MKIYRLLVTAALFLLLTLTVSATTRYVDVNSATATPPFLDWSTAATNIQDAVDAAVDGDQILVTNGVYSTGGTVIYGQETNRVALTNAIMLLSVNGPQATTIAGGTQTRCVYVGSNAVMSGFTLTNGFARTSGDAIKEMSGGGVWCEAGGVVTNCVIRNNSAPNGSTGGGGGVYGGMLYNCALIGNYGLLGGGARSSSLWNCSLTGNSSADGGASFQSTLRNCLVSNNSSTPAGGGTAFGTNYNCTITSNVCTGAAAGNQAYGGGTYRSDNYNCVIAGNSSLRGGGAYSGKLYNCTVVGNSANDGGGVHGADIPGYYTNCIIYFNTSPGGINNWSGGVYDHCCIYPMPGVSGNFTNDPVLVDWQTGFFQLKCGSPCVDSGEDLSVLYTNDVRGRLRPLDGNSDTFAQFDLGAYEFSPDFDSVPSIQAAYTNFATQFEVSFNGAIGGCASFFWWDFGDGVLLTNQPYVSHAWTSPGPYNVQLSAYYSSLGQTLTATTQVQVAQQQIHYVKATNPTPGFPYTNWLTAAANIQDAMGAAQTGDIVLVTNGVYGVGGTVVFGQETNRVVIPNTIKLLSVNGPAATTISGGTQTRCVYVSRDASLSGFTLNNGKTRNSGDAIKEMSGGGVWCETGGSVSNCIITANSALSSSGGGGGGAYGGMLYNCTFTGNTGFLGGGVRSAVLWNCTLTGNSAQGINGGGGAAYGATLYNCALSNNVVSAYVNGAGANQCLLSNCLVKGNTTTPVGGGASGNGGGTYLGTNYNCVIMNNAAGTNSGTGSGTGSGGGSYQSTNYNCLINGNRAGSSGGGAYQGRAYNCTVSSNTAASSGGGVYGGTLNNSIVYFNIAPSGLNWTGSPILNYCCTTPSIAGVGNISNDPQFVNAPGGMFQLKFGSPCIDAGFAGNFPFIGTTNDLAGSPRPMDGDGNGIARIDMGAYEFNLVATVGTNWFTNHGLDPNDPLVFASDPDGDGFTTLQEWIVGTDPTNTLSALKMLSPAGSVSGVSVTWQSASGVNYFLQRSTNLSVQPTFSVLQSNIVGQVGTTTYMDTSAIGSGPFFYRVGVQPWP